MAKNVLRLQQLRGGVLVGHHVTLALAHMSKTKNKGRVSGLSSSGYNASIVLPYDVSASGVAPLLVWIQPFQLQLSHFLGFVHLSLNISSNIRQSPIGLDSHREYSQLCSKAFQETTSRKTSKPHLKSRSLYGRAMRRQNPYVGIRYHMRLASFVL